MDELIGFFKQTCLESALRVLVLRYAEYAGGFAIGNAGGALRRSARSLSLSAGPLLSRKAPDFGVRRSADKLDPTGYGNRAMRRHGASGNDSSIKSSLRCLDGRR